MTIPDPQSQVDVDPTLQKLLEELKKAASANGRAVTDGAQPSWASPPGGSLDTSDWEAIAKALDRGPLNEKIAKALLEDTPGTSGDCGAGQLQIDYLACALRSFFARHASRQRCLALAAGRLKGQGSEASVFTASILTYLSNLIKRSKSGGQA